MNTLKDINDLSRSQDLRSDEGVDGMFETQLNQEKSFGEIDENNKSEVIDI